MTAPPADDAWPEVPGYEIVREAGEGGMGKVFQARQLEAGGRLAAIKVLKEDFSSARSADRFEREVSILSSLPHPHLATVYGSTRTASGTRCMILEWIEGEPLTDSWARRSADPLVMASEMEKVCAGVQAAHAVNVIHRDLKPANILCGDEGRILKVLDFGLARDAEPAERLSLSGAVVGSPGFMALEQGKGLPAGPPADVFSLGVILFLGLSGRLPYPGTSLYESLQSQESGRCQGFGKSSVPRDLQAIVMKALDSDPARRYRNAGEFGEDLARFLGGQPVSAQPPSAIYRARKFAGRHRFSTAVTLAALLTLAALGGWHLHTREQAARELKAEYAATLLVSAELAGQRGVWHDALTHIEAAKSAGTRKPGRAALAEIKALEALGRRREAAGVLEKHLDAIRSEDGILPGLPDYWQARFCEGVAGIDTARELLQKAKDAGLPPAEDAVASAMLTDDEGVASEILGKAAAAHPFNSDILLLHALIQAFTGHPAEAEAGIHAASLLFPQNADLPLIAGIIASATGKKAASGDSRLQKLHTVIGGADNLYELAWSGTTGLLKAVSPDLGLLTSFKAALPGEGLEEVSSLSIHFLSMTRAREVDGLITAAKPWTSTRKLETLLDGEMARLRPSPLRVVAFVTGLAEPSAKDKSLAEKVERHCMAAVTIDGIDPALRALLLDNVCAVAFNLGHFHKDPEGFTRMLHHLRTRLDIREIPLASYPADILSKVLLALDPGAPQHSGGEQEAPSPQAARRQEIGSLLVRTASRFLELHPESRTAKLRLGGGEAMTGNYLQCLRLLDSLPVAPETGNRGDVAERYRSEARAYLREKISPP